MKLSMDTRTYTNVILTVIGVALVALVLDTYRISGASSARAQSGYTSNIQKRVDSQVSEDNANKYDIAVAQATEKVADANREIAAAIRELAAKVDPLTDAIKAGRPAAAAATAAAPNAGAVEFSTTTP